MEKLWLKHYPPYFNDQIDITKYSSVNAIIDEGKLRYAERVLYTSFNTNITYERLINLSLNFASFLQNEFKVGKGDRVAIILPNCIQFPVAVLAILRLGAIVVAMNPTYTNYELENQLLDSGAATVIVLANFAHKVMAIKNRVAVKNIVVTRIGDLLNFPESYLTNFVVKYVKKLEPNWELPESISFEKSLNIGKKSTLKLPALTTKDIALLQYTGGTTGKAKGAVITHGNLIASYLIGEGVARSIADDQQDTIMGVFPMYHIAGLAIYVFFPFTNGMRVILIPDPRDINNLIKILKKDKVTVMHGVNTLYRAVLNHPQISEVDFKSMKIGFAGGAATDPHIREQWKSVTKTEIGEVYGMSETMAVISFCPNHLSRYDHSGMMAPGNELFLADDNGSEVKLGAVGEIWIRGPQITKEYWNNLEETRLSFTQDGWFKTGDMGFLDEDGFLHLVERKKNMILISGFNVYPSEIEQVLLKNPNVSEVAVVGVPDEKSGEKVKAFIVKKNPTLTENEVIEFCRQFLTNYKIPKSIVFIDKIPKTAVGKVSYKDLKNS